MKMKHTKYLLAMFLTLSLAACSSDSDDKPDPAKAIADDGSYTGTLKVTESAETTFSKEEVKVKVTLLEDKVEIKMFQVSFSERMPMSIDMTIPGITAVSTSSDKLTLSGDNIIPLAFNGEYPAYTITNLSGEITPKTITLNMTCGGKYPLSYSGSSAAKAE